MDCTVCSQDIKLLLTIRTEFNTIVAGVRLLEKRTAKVNISSAGGTAAKGSKTCKVTVPNTWLSELGIDMERRELELAFDGTQIILTRRMAGYEYAELKTRLGHDVRQFSFFDGAKLCTTVYADFTDETLVAENHVDNPVKTAFGNNALPVWADFQAFLEERCIPRHRSGLREYLDAIGVGAYDPLEIIQKTAGHMAEDDQWLEVKVYG